MLATIIFTDVVGFSRHANVNEPRALSALQRDFSLINSICVRFQGTVLKTMGDGMLMRFSSALQAVEAALEIQRALFVQSKSLPHEEVLEHRIGMHLGDVIITTNDVFGDGVNIASRLQDAAGPGSIYMSRTVYDVVKGKIKFPAVYIGPRQLKGIGDPVAIWEVPSMQKIDTFKRNQALDALTPGIDPRTENRNSGRSITIVVFVIAVIVLGIGGLTIFNRNRVNRWKDEGAAVRNLQQDSPKNSKTVISAPTATNDSGTQPGAGSVLDPSKKTPTDFNAVGDDPALFNQLRALFVQLKFQEMADLVQSSPHSGTDQGKLLVKTYTDLASLMDWVTNALDQIPQSQPLMIADDPATHAATSLYRQAPGLLAITHGPTTTSAKLSDLPKQELLAIANALVDRNSTSSSDVLSNVKSQIQELSDTIKVFDIPSSGPAPSP